MEGSHRSPRPLWPPTRLEPTAQVPPKQQLRSQLIPSVGTSPVTALAFSIDDPRRDRRTRSVRALEQVRREPQPSRRDTRFPASPQAARRQSAQSCAEVARSDRRRTRPRQGDGEACAQARPCPNTKRGVSRRSQTFAAGSGTLQESQGESARNSRSSH
jgi:hypothetical protein